MRFCFLVFMKCCKIKVVRGMKVCCRLVFKCGSPHLNANANAQNDSNANANANAQHFNQMQMQMQVRSI